MQISRIRLFERRVRYVPYRWTMRMGRRGVNQLPVVEDGRILRGVVTREGLLRWMSMTSGGGLSEI